MQIINQPSLSWSHSNKLLLTQWQFPNESINALTSNSFSVMLTFLHEKSHPERLSGRALSSYWASYAHEAHCKHTHTHPFSLLFYHTHTHTLRQKMIQSPAALASPRTSITASEHERPSNAHWRLPCNMDMSSLISATSVTIPWYCH